MTKSNANCLNPGDEQGKERLWTGIFIAVVACSLFMFLVGQSLNAGTTVYLQSMGRSTSLAGIGALMFSISAGIARIVYGPLIDARGRQIVILASSFIMLAGTVGPLFANDGAMFVVWRLVQGLGFSGATTASATAASDVLPKSRLGEGIGYFGLGQALAMSVGPAFGVALASSPQPANLYLGITAFVVACVVVGFLIRYERHPEMLPATAEYRVRAEALAGGAGVGAGAAATGAGAGAGAGAPDDGKLEAAAGAAGPSPSNNGEGASATKPGASKLKAVLDLFEPSALRGAIPIFFISCSFCFSIFYMGVYGTYLGVSSPGLFYTFSAVTMILIRLFGGKLMDTIAPIWLMLVAVLCGLLAFGVMIAVPFLNLGAALTGVFYLAGIPYGVSIGLAIPVNQTVSVRASKPERLGAANALYLLAADFGIGISSFIWGFTIESVGYTGTLVAVLGGITASLFAAAICYPKQEKRL